MSKTIRIVFKPTKNVVTRQAEGAQCAFLAMAQLEGDGSISLDSWDEVYNKYVDIDTSISEMIEILTDDWLKSSEKIARHLSKKLNFTDYVFHRNSKNVQQIYRKFNELNKLLHISDQFTHSDKWQPADIWAIRENTEMNLSSCKSISELNNWLTSMLDIGSIIPISLKKNDRTKPNIIRVNVDGANNVQADVEFLYSKISTGKSNWMSSKNTAMVFKRDDKSGTITFRNSSPRAATNAEISMVGCNYNLGKLKREVVSDIINKYAAIPIPLYDLDDIRKRSYDLDPTLIRQVYDLASLLDPCSEIEYKVFEQFIADKANNRHTPDRDWLSSKYQSMLILQSFGSIPTNTRQLVFHAIFQKAVAMDKLCAPRLEVK